MVNVDHAAVCGLCCSICEYRESNPCGGCLAVEGRPTWVDQVDLEVCPLYECCVTERGLEHCGMCDDLPCEQFLSSHDPSLGPEEAREDIRRRAETLRRRRDIGTRRWLEEQISSGEPE